MGQACAGGSRTAVVETQKEGKGGATPAQRSPTAQRSPSASGPGRSPHSGTRLPRVGSQEDKTCGKVWPGTYNLGVDKDALTPCTDAWEREKDDRGRAVKKLGMVASKDGTVLLTCLARLGQGAQGGVWKCEDKAKRVCAVKAFDKRKLREEQINNCLHNPAIWHEFQLLRRVGHHPGIVECDGLVLESDTHFYVPMEYVPGIDLHTRLWGRDRKTGRPLDTIPLDPKRTYRDVMEAFAFCHEHAVAHRDLKPTNVMLSPQPDGRPPVVKVMDFGLGAEVPEYDDGTPVQMRRPVGTTAWCAPEVLKLYCTLQKDGGLGPSGKKAGTEAQDDEVGGYYARPADIWSSGVLLWEIMTGDHLFHRPQDPDQSRKELLGVRNWQSIPESLEQHQLALWEALEPGAQALLRRILTPEAQLRPKAAEILKDPWLAV